MKFFSIEMQDFTAKSDLTRWIKYMQKAEDLRKQGKEKEARELQDKADARTFFN